MIAIKTLMLEVRIVVTRGLPIEGSLRGLLGFWSCSVSSFGCKLHGCIQFVKFFQVVLLWSAHFSEYILFFGKIFEMES